MSTATLKNPPQPDVSPGSMQTLVSRPLPPQKDPTTSKRVCFYKSGDPQFTGHRMVINSRTFKTFDALLDTLSKKVPLSFGVRTITTPRGTHAVRTLDDLQDGASYLCSDQKKVKPINLDEVNKTQVPWNTTRPISAGLQARRALVRRLVRRSDGTTRPGKVAENNAVVRTPKRLTVYKNKDPSIKRVIILQRRTAPNFEALLDYLSQVMQFPVLKLYTEDGSKVEGLPGLILCSGIVVAAGNEPFRMGKYNLHDPTKTKQPNSVSESLGPTQTETLLEENNKAAGPISRSRNFSLSSERFLVEQINKSLNGSLSEPNWQKTESMESEGSQPMGSEDNGDCEAGTEERNHPIMPTEDDIEKSFRVNEDGSMTVEMKVHLTIKQEEMVHWTTTLSRTSINYQPRAVGTSKPGSCLNSLDVPTDSGKESNGPHSLESKEMNTHTDRCVGFIEAEQENYSSAVSQTSETLKPIYRRLPTPGHKQKRKEASMENIKRVSETEVQESTVGAYSYMERTAQGELTEGYCVVSRSSSSSTRTLSKPRRSEPGETKQKKSHSFRSSHVADVLQLQNNGTTGITETVLHIYESEGTCDNYYANTQMDVLNKHEYCTKAMPRSRPGSTDSGPRSSSNDCDVDLTRQSTSCNSEDGGKNEILSLSSSSSTPQKIKSNNMFLCVDNEQQALEEFRFKSTEIKMLQQKYPMEEDAEDKKIKSTTKTNTPKSKKSKKSTSSDSSGPGKKLKSSIQGSTKGLQMTNTSETLSHTGSEKKTHSSAESDQHKNGRGKNRKTKTLEGSPKSRNLNPNRRSEKELKLRDKTIKDDSNNINTNYCDSLGTTSKTNVLANKSSAHSAPLKKRLAKQRSMNGVKPKTSKPKQELSESVSLPVLQPSPSNVNQYVENWLQKIQPDSLPFDDDMDHLEYVPRAVFQIGSDSADVSEIKSEPEKDSVVDEGPSLEDDAMERPVSRPPVQIRYEGEPFEVQRVKGFCKSMPSVRVLPVEQEGLERMHKSSENLAPPEPFTGGGASHSTGDSTSSGMKPVLKQLCLSIQSIRQASSQTLLAPAAKEKSSSLPDFSSQVASAFGSPSRAFLSFLSLMTLRDGKSILGKEESQDSNSEALQVMQSLEKICTIKDEEELKASLTSLQSSASSQLKQSWRDFQEKNVFGESPPLSPRQSEQEFALDVDSGGEEEEHNEENNFDIEQLMEELNMSEDLRKEISTLVEGELKSETNLNRGHFEMSGKEEENEDGSVDGSLEKAADMEVEKENCEENTGLENETSKDEITDDPTELESNFIQPHSPDLETVAQDLINEESGVTVPNQTLEENCSDSSKAEILETADNNQISNEAVKETCDDLQPDDIDAEQNPTSQQHLTDIAGEAVSKLSDDENNMSEKDKNIAADSIEDRNTCKEEEAMIQSIRQHSKQSDVSEPESTDATSEQIITDFIGEEPPKFSDDQDNMPEGEKKLTSDNIDENGVNAEQDTIQNIRELTEQSDVSEPENTDVTSQQKLTDLLGEDQPEISDDQDNMSEEENNTSPDNIEERDINAEQDTMEFTKEFTEQSDASEPENTDATAEQQLIDITEEEQPEFSDDQDNMSEGKNKTTPDNIEESDIYAEHDTIQNIRDVIEQSDVSEPENTDATSEQQLIDISGEQPEFSDDQDNMSEGKNNTAPDNVEERDINAEQDAIGEFIEQSDVSEPENTDATAEQQLTDISGEEQPEFSDDQDNMSEGENNTTSDNIDENDMNAEQDTIQNIRELTEQSDVSEPENTDATSQQKLTDLLKEQPEFSDYQDNISEEENNTSQDHIEESNTNAEQDTVQNIRDHIEQSDVSEAEDPGLASGTEKKTGEETEHSEFEEDNGEEEEHEQENKSESQHSEDSKSLSHHHHSLSQHSVHVLESDSQEDDQRTSPDVAVLETDQQEDAVSETSECENPDPHYNNSSPEHCSNDENSTTFISEIKAKHDKTQHIDNGLVEEDSSRDEDHEISEVCELVDPDAEAGSSKISDPEAENVTGKNSSTSHSEKCSRAQSEVGSLTDKTEGSAEFCDEENSMLNRNAIQQNSVLFEDNINGCVERESCSSMKTNSCEHQSEEVETLGKEHGYHYLLHPTEISQELLDLINSALLSSTLTVTYDSNGNLRIEPDKGKMREMFRAQHQGDDEYGQKCLPSPRTSDLSDYRTETSSNGGYHSRASMEILSDSEEEQRERLQIFRRILKQSYENPKNRVKENSSMKSSTETTGKHTPSSSLDSNNSLASFQDSKSMSQEPICYSRTSSYQEHPESVQCMTLNGDVKSEEGVLIDKGRWLLKENHLIRKSPPVCMGMYGNGDTTSADTGQDNMSEDAPYPYYENQNSPLAAISSSELEDMAKPPTPKCTYFNMPHSSGSDPLSDAQSLSGGKSGGDKRRNKELRVSPMGQPSKTWARNNGSLSSFASVEFKLPDGKVHPQDGGISGAVNSSQNVEQRTSQEEESRVGLNLRCGQHCPIL